MKYSESDEARISAAVSRIVDSAPPITAEQRDFLSTTLRPSKIDNGRECASLHETEDERARRERRKLEQQVAARKCAIYRHYDSDGVLLYVGISGDSDGRRRQHMKSAPWLRFQASESVSWLPGRESARIAELAAIEQERPIFNVANAADGAIERRVRYLAEREAWDLLRSAQ